MSPFLLGLEKFGLTLQKLKNISQPIKVTLTFQDPKAIHYQNFSLPERKEKLENFFLKTIKKFLKQYNITAYDTLDTSTTSLAILKTWTDAKTLEQWTKDPSLHHILIEKIEGKKLIKSSPNKTASQTKSWYTVKALLVLQIENQTTGTQTTEERYFLVKARSVTEARQKAVQACRSSEEPYFNHQLLLLRWKLIKITDVYELYPSDNPEKIPLVETYSSLKIKKITPLTSWITQK